MFRSGKDNMNTQQFTLKRNAGTYQRIQVRVSGGIALKPRKDRLNKLKVAYHYVGELAV